MTILGLAARTAGSFYALGKEVEKLPTIGKNANDNCTKLLDFVVALQERLGHEVIALDELDGIRADADHLPKHESQD